MKKKALVLGGGLQGVLAAFKLDKIEYDVTIVEKSEKLLNRASRLNEGKIHLGIIYANDKSYDSAKYMMKSAMCFDTMIEGIVGERAPWQKWLSSPFY
jgi:L-2-hydroxyglutarate oxidase LhgO